MRYFGKKTQLMTTEFLGTFQPKPKLSGAEP